ncbi:MAG: hypothetical protein IJ043_06275 [Clostridia bacterium]|nr:hypothetical protein [Clostridia bacterium]
MAVSYKSVEDAYKKKNQAIDKQVAADGNAYDAQRQDVTDSSADTLQQIYLQKERAEASQRQQQKAAGITGGAAESADIALQANYSTNRTNTLLERDKQLSQIGIQQEQAKAQAEIEKRQNDVEMETGRLSFNQDEQQQRRSELWELVRTGTYTQKMANELGYDLETLKQMANYYKEN